MYHYPGFTPGADGARLGGDIVRTLTRTTGFEAVMRVRCSKVRVLRVLLSAAAAASSRDASLRPLPHPPQGVSITNFYGNFFIRGSDLLALPNVTCDTSFNVELAHEEVLPQGGVVVVQVRLFDDGMEGGRGSVIVVHVRVREGGPALPMRFYAFEGLHFAPPQTRLLCAAQSALLYTSFSGERRICVHTLARPVTTILADLFRGVRADAVANMLSKVSPTQPARVFPTLTHHKR